MKRPIVSSVVVIFTTIASIAAAQSGAGVASGGGRRGPGEPALPPEFRLDFLAGEVPLGPIVVGAPYSGEGVTTTSQTLADGTRIERTVRARLYRDSEGRTRREQTILGLGAIGESHAITIVDPVAGVMYTLNPATRQGRRSSMPVDRLSRLRDAVGSLERGRGNVPPVPPLPPPLPPAPAISSGAPPAPPGPPPPPPPPDAARRGARDSSDRPSAAAAIPRVAPVGESLGTQQIEGLNVTGRRTTVTIPTGQIGNDRPIEITDERWDSPELKVLVLSKHHDPRTGDVEYRLTNVNRAEPPRELFTPPADYTITDAPPPPPPAPRRP